MNEQEPKKQIDFERSRTRAGLMVFGSILLLVATVFFTIRFRSSGVLLNVSYDASHGFFHEIDPIFQQGRKKIRVRSSHAGSVEQAGSVLRGLRADVVTLASAAEIDAISEKGYISSDWRKRFPHNSSPFSSTILFLVRSGNPRNIIDWNDLIRKDVNLVIPGPKVSGAGRWAYLAAWIYSMEKNADENQAEQFLQQLYSRDAAVNKGARAALLGFMSQSSGDVLVTWESEAWHALSVYGPEQVEIIYPSVSIKAEPVVAVVDQHTQQRNTTHAAEAYLHSLFAEGGQKAAAKNFLRPYDTSVPLWDLSILSKTRLVSIEDSFGNWEKAVARHFSDGGTFDRINPSRR